MSAARNGAGPGPGAIALTGGLAAMAAIAALALLGVNQRGPLLILAILAFWAASWRLTVSLAAIEPRGRAGHVALQVLIPVVFGVSLLFLWEFVVRALQVPIVLLPAPSDIGVRIANSLPILWVDFVQTFLKAVVAGYVIGCASGFAVAVLVDRSSFLKRGLLPVGNLVSALPIVGVAPIMVMWFGFDWPSKAAVVVVTTLFPMLVNTLAGLSATSRQELDLMRSYAASHTTTLLIARLPNALPFLFNGLKISATLALIAAIVAEFFGTPVVGMGFRISTEVARMNVDVVWATILVAAIAGSGTYAALSFIERRVTFWHPAMRGR